MSLDFGLTGTHVLVSGASGGIGFEIARLFLSLGADVTAHYNSSPRTLADLPAATALQAELTSESEVARLFAEANRIRGKPVSVLVVNHGIWPEEPATVADMKLAQWKNTLDVNLTGAFLLCSHFLQQLKDAPTSVLDSAGIIFIGSTAGKFGEADHADYSASKAALMYGLMPTLKNEIVAIAPKGRVNCVNPGWVRTPLAEKTLSDPKVVTRALSSTPLQKVATTRDVALQVAVLASPVFSGHVSGMNVMVDGGMEGRLLFPP